MNLKKRAKRAKNKAKQANRPKVKSSIAKNSSSSGVINLDMHGGNVMKTGVQNKDGKIVRVITTQGSDEFAGAVSEYVDLGYTDIYADNTSIIDGLNAMMIPN